MPLDPQLTPLLDLFNSLPQPARTDAAGRRAAKGQDPLADGSLYADYLLPRAEVNEIWEERIPVNDPVDAITVRVYRPTPSAAGAAGAMVHLHGGGFWSGGLEDVDRRCRAMAAGAGVVVVSVDYRLAPEFPFPTALHDAHAALRWTTANAARLGVDPTRIGIGGESAGANIAAALALLVRDRGEPAPRLQLLEIPLLDCTLSSPSVRTYAEGHVLTAEDAAWCVEQYLGDRDRTAPLASPALAQDLTGLPPAVIASAECDPLADDARRYAERLKDAGTPVEFTCYPGMVHGSHILTGLLPTARSWQDDTVAAVRAHLSAVT
ncbi:alpha/beta hydrolase [Streptomyces sp. NPDC057137]|uniref:alpha/beta hydrolase n=1 Tax=Streptomyces sp. NPDC057137 TaxID=3346030 RepID=UPI003637D6B5